MTTDKEVIDYLISLKQQFDQSSDKYADISQTIHYIRSHDVYNVYEVLETDERFLGSVRSESLDDAVEKTHDRFGAPISVTKAD